MIYFARLINDSFKIIYSISKLRYKKDEKEKNAEKMIGENKMQRTKHANQIFETQSHVVIIIKVVSQLSRLSPVLFACPSVCIIIRRCSGGKYV